jgi:hypothetical protein
MTDRTDAITWPDLAPRRTGRTGSRRANTPGRLAGLLTAAAALLAGLAPGASANTRDWSSLALSGPHTAGNLAVYFLHGPSQPGPVPLTLGEALKQARVVVHETGNVERLEVENTGGEAVFVQAGDIVKGGRQDRVLTVSLLIPPRSGRVAIGSYCVGQGRWSRRGAESASRFTSAEARMPSLAAKRSLYARKAAPGREAQRTVPPPRSLGGTRAEQSRPDVQQRIVTLNRVPDTGARNEARSRQAEIWADVAEVQRKLGANLATSVRSHISGSSLQLSLENQKLAEEREKLAGQLLAHGTARDDIVGYAFAINGRINSVEVYPSNGLFRKMWPKLLQATTTEAIAEQDDPAATSAVPASDKVKAFIAETAGAGAERDQLNAGLVSERRETKRTIANETRRADGTMVHLSILAR